MVAATET